LLVLALDEGCVHVYQLCVVISCVFRSCVWGWIGGIPPSAE
jgi:hypothetical protein